LLAHFGIDRPMTALHEHNERDAADKVLRRLQAGEDVALVSDAGTPLISDPGFRLVRVARAGGIRVSPLPGACAAIAALSVAGLPSDRFVFEGFLPSKATARQARLRELGEEARTLVFYESSHRIVQSLADMRDAFGPERQAVFARELTKRFETVLDETLRALAQRVADDPDQRRGECVVLVAGHVDPVDARVAEGRRAFDILRAELPPARAAKLAAAITGAPRRLLYEKPGIGNGE
jgi:16S rRNA (cytidine1402-2'-O)-methyltransferase